MKAIKLVTLLFILIIIPNCIHAQTIETENTYQLDGKAKRGVLAHVEVNLNGNYDLYYVTKVAAKKVKFLVYTFDTKFNFVSKKEEIVALEKVKMKFSWLPYRGELYTVEGISLNFNPAYSLKLTKKRITYKYDWLVLGYYKTVETLAKVKPRTDDGLKYFAFKYWENEIDGSLTIVAGAAPGGMSKDAGNRLTDIRLLKFDSDLNKVAETKIPFKFGQSVAFAEGFGVSDPDNSAALGFDGGAIVFAPTEWKGSSAPVDKNYGNFTYVEFDANLEIISRKSFTSPSPGWNIQEMQFTELETGEREVYLYGAAALGKDKFHQYAVQSSKLKSIQVMKVSKGEISYLSEITLDDIEAAKKMPSNNKKTEDYNGKQRLSFQFHLTNSGNIILYGQYYKGGVPGDFTAFEFDQGGKLVANYTKNLDLQAKDVAYECAHYMMENENGIYWISYQAHKAVTYIAPVITRIDPSSKAMSNSVVLGSDGKKQAYFIDSSFPMLGVSANEQVYFGSDMKGKNIWFSRVKL